MKSNVCLKRVYFQKVLVLFELQNGLENIEPSNTEKNVFMVKSLISRALLFDTAVNCIIFNAGCGAGNAILLYCCSWG